MVVLSITADSGALAAWLQAIGSISAVLAAIAISWCQNKAARAKDDALRKRRERAAHAVTPLALSELCAWSKSHLQAWLEAADKLEHRKIEDILKDAADPAFVEFVSISDDVVRNIKEVIEYSDDISAAPYVALLNRLQVHKTRALGFLADVQSSHTVTLPAYCRHQAVEVAELYARATALFDHARDEASVEASAVNRDQVTTALHLMGVYLGTRDDITAIVNRRYAE